MSKFPLCIYVGLGYVDKVIGFEPVKKHFDE
jgi:hypothetical protein